MAVILNSFYPRVLFKLQRIKLGHEFVDINFARYQIHVR